MHRVLDLFLRRRFMRHVDMPVLPDTAIITKTVGENIEVTIDRQLCDFDGLVLSPVDIVAARKQSDPRYTAPPKNAEPLAWGVKRSECRKRFIKFVVPLVPWRAYLLIVSDHRKPRECSTLAMKMIGPDAFEYPESECN